jgi:single-stranded DNA-binding protein
MIAVKKQNKRNPMNYATIMGRVGRDPETKQTKSGLTYTSVSLCASAGKDKSMWWTLYCWGDGMQNVLRHIKKGSSIAACGRINEPTMYTDKTGNQRISMSLTCTNISFCPSSERQNASPQAAAEDSGYDEIPF